MSCWPPLCYELNSGWCQKDCVKMCGQCDGWLLLKLLLFGEELGMLKYVKSGVLFVSWTTWFFPHGTFPGGNCSIQNFLFPLKLQHQNSIENHGECMDVRPGKVRVRNRSKCRGSSMCCEFPMTIFFLCFKAFKKKNEENRGTIVTCCPFASYPRNSKIKYPHWRQTPNNPQWSIKFWVAKNKIQYMAVAARLAHKTFIWSSSSGVQVWGKWL